MGIRISMSNPKISFIILIWNSEKYLIKCFDSIICKCSDEDILFEIIAIDNGSQDTSYSIIQEYNTKYPGIFQTIRLDSNRGTTYPRNLGLNKALGNYICILDSDTNLYEGTLSKVIINLSNNNNIGIIAPRLLLSDGSVQNSVKRFPTMVDKFMKIPRIILGMKTRNNDFYEDFPFVEERVVDSAISACWFFRKDLLHKVGYLDENIFYSPEDLDYSLRIKKVGSCILYYPGFTVIHHTQQITHKRPFSITSFSHLIGLLYYFKKHGGWFKRQC
jgi:GT2 family glycosyltransferase